MKPTFSYLSTHVYIQEGLLESCSLEKILQLEKRKPVIVTNHSMKKLYADPLAAKIGAQVLVVSNGEEAKSLETKHGIEQKLFESGYGKDTLLIALGGGSVTDVVGFIASTYLRGIPLALIPTSLLAMVDASIGGKTGVNTPFGKNLLGTFYNPESIFVDTNLLSSLPEKELLYGASEILKMGLIADSFLWDLLEKNLLKGFEFLKDPSLIGRSIENKMKIVEQDPKDNGLRRILNFGHTIAHGLEALSSYGTSHGEAVLIGCAAESHLSQELGYLPYKDFERIASLYSQLPLSLPKDYTRKSLEKFLLQDKKRDGKNVRFVLLDKIGHALAFEGAHCRNVSNEEMEKTLTWMETTFG